jgi:hypothetical protein
VPLEFIDLPVRESEQEPPRTPIRLPDTWLIARHGGLQGYLDAAEARIERGRCSDDDAREREMARRLRVHLDAGRRVLFVCGLAHWRQITALLDAGPSASARVPSPRVSVPAASFKVFGIHAAGAWLAGWLGIPAIIAAYVQQKLSSGQGLIDRFDLPAECERFEARATAELQAIDDLRISPRQALVFRQYLKALLGLGGRFVPRLDGDYHHAAESCVGQPWADALKAAALQYPYDPPRSTPRATLVQREDTLYLVADGRAHAVGRAPTAADSDRERRSLPASAAPLSTRERMAAGLLPVTRSLPPEDQLQRECVHWAWTLGEQSGVSRRPKAGTRRSARFTGNLGRGIDIRRTHRAWAAGDPESEFFVKLTSSRGMPGGRSRHELMASGGTPCPVAWIFAPGAEVRHEASARMFDVYSSSYWLSSVERLDGGITRERVAYAVNYCRGRADRDDEASTRTMVDALSAAERCRIPPWDDPELTGAGFHGPRLAVAAAIRWARNRAIVVADDDFDPGLQCRTYARRRGIALVAIPWRAFGEATRRRFALQYTARSRSQFTEPPPCVLRVIPAVPPFNPPREFRERGGDR